jgi:4-amino-4-deoxy-L-arabinose transferase-like glycosyltransferase
MLSKPNANDSDIINKPTFLVLLVLAILVNSVGLFNDIFAADSSLYAAISKTFVVSGDYINIYVKGADWLDKPHFPFWICALFMEVFGINTIAYKLPSLLFFIAGLYYTYKLAKSLYNTQTAYLATLILASSLHMIISNNDVRAESILVGLLMGATYYIYKLTSKFSFQNILLASLFSAAAIMTKGIFVMIIPSAAIFGHLIVTKQFNKLFDYKWLILFSLTILFTAPEIYALYEQFDTKPDKIVFGKTGVSGIQFFLWDSQFGRFFNTGPIKGKSEPFFFVHTFLWAFAPWALIGFVSLFKTGANLITRKFNYEYLTFFGFVIMFLIFSISRFQLSHYLNILFPFISITIAGLLIGRIKMNKAHQLLKVFINLYLVVFIGVISLLEIYFNQDFSFTGIVLLLSLTSLGVFFNFIKKQQVKRFYVLGIISSLLFTLYLNLSFYPKLLKYQSGAQMAFYANQNFPDQDIFTTNNDWLLDYYLEMEVIPTYTLDRLTALSLNEDDLLFADDAFIKLLEDNALAYELIETFDHFHITLLDLNFLDKSTREKSLQKRYLINLE